MGEERASGTRIGVVAEARAAAGEQEPEPAQAASQGTNPGVPRVRLRQTLQRGDVGQVRDRDEEPAPLGIEGGARPVGPAAGKRVEDRPLQARGREEALVAEPLELAAAAVQVLGGRGVEVVLGELLRNQRWRLGGDGLRRPGALARHVARRDRALLHREERTTGLAVEHEDEARLGSLGHGVDGAALVHDTNQDGRRGQVVVPQVVVHGLEVPDALAGLRVEGHDGVRVQVRPGSVAAVEVRARGAHGQENPATGEVRGDGGPDVGGARAGGAGLPGLVARLALVGDGVEGPHAAAAAHVEGPDVARGRIRPDRVGNGGAHHDHVAHDGARRGHVVLVRVGNRLEVGQEVHGATGSEVCAGRPGGGVERDETRVEGGEEDAARAAALPVRLAPVGHATVDDHVGVEAREVDARIEGPELPARLGVEGDHAVVGRGEEQSPVDDEGRGLEGGALVDLVGEGPLAEVSVAVGPGHLEPTHVARMDVGERRVAAPAGRSLGDGPVGGLALGRADESQRERRQEQAKRAHGRVAWHRMIRAAMRPRAPCREGDP